MTLEVEIFLEKKKTDSSKRVRTPYIFDIFLVYILESLLFF